MLDGIIAVSVAGGDLELFLRVNGLVFEGFVASIVEAFPKILVSIGIQKEHPILASHRTMHPLLLYCTSLSTVMGCVD